MVYTNVLSLLLSSTACQSVTREYLNGHERSGKISDAVTRVIDLLYGETATGSAADVLAERHLPVAARRFPRAYPLEPGLWRNLLDDDRAFA